MLMYGEDSSLCPQNPKNDSKRRHKSQNMDSGFRIDTSPNQRNEEESRHENGNKSDEGMHRVGFDDDDHGIELVLSAVKEEDDEDDAQEENDRTLQKVDVYYQNVKKKKGMKSLFKSGSSVTSSSSRSKQSLLGKSISLIYPPVLKRKSEFGTSCSSNSRSMLISDPSVTSTTSSSRININCSVNQDDPWRAAKRGDMKALKKLHFDKAVDWAAKDKQNNTPLYYAIQSGAFVNIEVVPFLLSVTERRSRDGCIEQCREYRLTREVTKILNEFATREQRKPLFDFSVNQDDPWRAAKRGDMKALKKLHFDKAVDWAEKDNHNNIPLYYAIQSGAFVNIEVVPFLLSVTERRSRDGCIEQCREYRLTREVTKILNEFETREQRRELTTNAGYDTDVSDNIPAQRLHLTFGKDMDAASKVRQSSIAGILSRHRRERTTVIAKTQLSPRPTRSSYSTGRSTGAESRGRTNSRKYKGGHSVPEKNSTGIGRTRAGAKIQLPAPVSKGASNSNFRTDARNLISEHSFGSVIDDSRQNTSWEPSLGDASDNWSLGSILSFRRDRKKKKKMGGSRSTNSIKSNSEKQAESLIKYEERERKWIIANQIKAGMSTNDKLVLTIHVYDSKQQVCIYNCHDVTIHIQGRKMKALMMEKCSHINVIFDTIISACEVVNCTSVAVQTTGVCPTFTVDKTDGITVWLSRESMDVSNFVTSKCTEVNISVPLGEDEGDRKEVALPEQFVHKLEHGQITSQSRSVFG